MPRVDVRTLPDPILFRLHLVAQELLQEEDGTKQTNWAHVVQSLAARSFAGDFLPVISSGSGRPIRRGGSVC